MTDIHEEELQTRTAKAWAKFRCCRCSRRPLPLGHSGMCFPVPVVVPIVDVMKKAEYKRCTYCTRQKSTQVAAKTEPTLQKNGLKIIAKLILGIRSALLGSSLRRSEHQEADQAEIERTILENRTEPNSHKNLCQK